MYKRIAISVLLCYLIPSDGLTQYRGGEDEGFSTFLTAILQNELPAIYIGGWWDGFYSLDGYFDMNPIPSIYTGGTGDGFDKDSVFNQNEFPVITHGGVDDGFYTAINDHQNVVPEIAHGGPGDGIDLFPEIYYLNHIPYTHLGGWDDGFGSNFNTNANSSCGDNYFVWTGEVNELWHESGNWECRIVPGIYSHVLIPDGLDGMDRFYPVVYDHAEVSTIRLRPGAYLQIEGGVMMILNGN